MTQLELQVNSLRMKLGEQDLKLKLLEERVHKLTTFAALMGVDMSRSDESGSKQA